MIFSFLLALQLLASTHAILFKEKSCECAKNDAKQPQTFLWMSEFPSKSSLCDDKKCKVLKCRLYQLSAVEAWPEDSYYEVSRNKLKNLQKWCEWGEQSDEEDADKRKGLLGRIREKMKNMLIYPGTKWCGVGNQATSYDDLGVHAEVDVCCREHDNCPYFIPSGQCVKNRKTADLCNKSSITMSHCKCDIRFHQCLRHVNTTTAEIINAMYFSMVNANCFAAGQDDDMQAYRLTIVN